VPNPDSAKIKQALRRQLRTISVADPVVASRTIVGSLATLLRAHPEWHGIAIFAALPREPDLAELPSLFPDRAFFYPRVQEKTMTFHQVADPRNELIAGPWGLSEPMPSLPLATAADIDVILCPGTAFTRDGKRLGKGGGYYDRYLHECGATRPRCIGVTFAAMIVDDLPHEAHDIIMDQVVSEIC